MLDDSITDLTRGVYRRLYSGFTKGQRINRLSLEAEAWFWRVLVTVDDFGNGDADPDLCRDITAGRRKVTSAQVFKWLEEMRSAGLIEIYCVKGELYLHIVGFEVAQPAGRNGKRIRRAPPPEGQDVIQVNPDLSSASDSEDDSDSQSDTEKVVRAAKPRSPRKVTTCDDDFLDELQSDEAYQLLDVRLVYAKMVRWCKQKSKVPTRARLIGWLNREDQPLNGNSKEKPPDPGKRRWSAPVKNENIPSISPEEFAKLGVRYGTVEGCGNAGSVQENC